jgi:hypothetical protein
MDERVSVVVRVRPLTLAERRAGQAIAWAQSHDSIWPTLPRPLSATGVDRPMGFDRVFGPDATNRAMYDELVHDRVERVLQARTAAARRFCLRPMRGALAPPAPVCYDRLLPQTHTLSLFVFQRAG